MEMSTWKGARSQRDHTNRARVNSTVMPLWPARVVRLDRCLSRTLSRVAVTSTAAHLIGAGFAANVLCGTEVAHKTVSYVVVKSLMGYGEFGVGLDRS